MSLQRNDLLLHILILILLTSVVVKAAPRTGSSHSNVSRMIEIDTQSTGIAPYTQLSKALLAGPTGSTPADINAQKIYIENALAKYGTNDPWAARAFYLIGVAESSLGKNQDAIADFDACIKLPEPYSGIHLAAQQSKMVAQSLVRDYSGAIETSRDLVNTDGPNILKRKLQGNALLLRAEWQALHEKDPKKGAKDAAITYSEYLHYVDKYPSQTGDDYQAFAIQSLGAVLQHSGQLDKSMKVYSDYLAKYPKSLEAIRVAMDLLGIKYKGVLNIPPNELEIICNKYPTNSGYGQQVFYQLGFNHYNNSNFISASKAAHKAWHMTIDKADTQYSEDLAGKAAILEMRALNFAKMVIECDTIGKEIITRFKGTEYAQAAQRMLDSHKTSSPKNSVNNFVRIGLLVLAFSFGMLRVYYFLARKRMIKGGDHGSSN